MVKVLRTPRRLVKVLVFACVLAAGTSAGARTTSTRTMPIQRFIEVSERLYRGAQPDRDGFVELERLGVRVVISLRTEDDERELVESLGMRYVHIPTTLHAFGLSPAPPSEDIRRFFSVLDDPQAGRVFVHCRRGADRTGLFVALYRITRQGWSSDAAYSEARAIGMRWWHYRVRGMLDRLAPFASARQLAPSPQIGGARWSRVAATHAAVMAA